MNDAIPPKTHRLFCEIKSRAEAEIAARQGGGILLALGVFHVVATQRTPATLYDIPGAFGLHMILLGALILKGKSRTAALIALALAASIVFALLWEFKTVRAASSEGWFVILVVTCVVASFGALRSVQGTFVLYIRYLETHVQWRCMIRLWIRVFLYTIATALVAPTVVAFFSPPGSIPPVEPVSFLLTWIVFFLGCMRWLPFTGRLVVLRNETDERDALPF